MTTHDLHAWLAVHEGIASRDAILRAGFSLAVVRSVMRSPSTRVLRRRWIATAQASPAAVAAAEAGGIVTCLSFARERRWWMPPEVDDRIHLHLQKGSGGRRVAADAPIVTHWSRSLVRVDRDGLRASVEDALAHVALCLPRDEALVVWESAASVEKIAPEALRAVAWRSRVARDLAGACNGLSDSGLETLTVLPLRRRGWRVRQQVSIAGRRVDLLVEKRLVVQIDGFEFHSSSTQRTKDIPHDAELRLRGYTVLRFSYAQVVHDWSSVERTIERALAAGLHAA